MIDRLIEYSLGNRFVVILATLLLIAVGILSLTKLPIDAVPDLTNVQVQVLTQSPGLGPVEVEQFITFPVETSLSGMPRIEEIRSLSLPGIAAITVVFEEGTDIYWARNLINERLQEARNLIPNHISDPQMGPIATGLGEIYHFEFRNAPGFHHDLMALRTVLEWQIAYQLRSVPGVIEVNTHGGELKTYEVQIDPGKLLNYNVALTQLFDAILQNNGNEGGGYIVHEDEQQLVRGEALITSLDEIASIVVDSRSDGTSITVGDVADVRFAPQIRNGAATRDGRGEVVTGTAMLLIGENSRVVAQRVRERLSEIEKSLPEGVVIDTFYDRTALVDRTIATVRENITGGAVLVIVMLFLLLGDLRAGLIVAASIPLSALFKFTAMYVAGVPANLMSLGALDFGIIVDGSVVMVEQIVRRLALANVSGKALAAGAVGRHDLPAAIHRMSPYRQRNRAGTTGGKLSAGNAEACGRRAAGWITNRGSPRFKYRSQHESEVVVRRCFCCHMKNSPHSGIHPRNRRKLSECRPASFGSWKLRRLSAQKERMW